MGSKTPGRRRGVNRSWVRKAINFMLFQAGWYALVKAAAAGHAERGMLAGAAIVAYEICFGGNPRGRIIVLLLAAGAIGFTVDSAHILLGVFQVPGPLPFGHLCPLWLVMLWMVFATTLRSSTSWMAGRYIAGSLLGAIGGPLSYWAGAKLGAATLQTPPAFSLIPLAISWALTTPLIIWLADRLIPLKVSRLEAIP